MSVFSVVITIIAAAFVSLAVLFLFGKHMAMSVLAGSAIGMVNFYVLTLLVKKITTRKWMPLVIFSWFIKFGVLIALIWLAIVYSKLDPIGFLAGLTLVVIAVIYGGFRAIGGQSG